MNSSRRAWAWLGLVLAARAYRAVLLTLVAVTVAPLVLGWSSYVIRTGSMEPALEVGDVVVAQPLGADEEVDVGRVFVLDDPASAGRLLVHRVVERRDDGTFTTAGDANEVTDATPVEREGVHHQATLLAPFVGLPTTWAQEGRFLVLGGWVLLTVAALLLSFRRVVVDDEDPGAGDGMADGVADGSSPPTPVRRGAAAATVVAALAAVLVPVVVGQTASAAFTARTVNPGSSWVAGSFVQPYVAAVLADRPTFLWLLDEAGGTAGAADRSDNNRVGQYTSIAAYRQPGDGLPRNAGFSVYPGDSGRVVMNGGASSAPSTYSVELWFRTTSTTGGMLVGFENSRNATSSEAERQVYLDRAGRLVYGNWPSSFSGTLQSPSTYLDGRWHHVVVTASPRLGNLRQDSVMFVDGVAVDSGVTARANAYTGWWRAGAGTRPTSGSNLPTTAGFRGQLDNVAVYPQELSAARVAAHYAAR